MAKKISRQQIVERAMSRLNVHKANLVCVRGASYGGNIQSDIESVLEELHRRLHRTHRESAAAVATDADVTRD